jgi:hypothetical protein
MATETDRDRLAVLGWDSAIASAETALSKAVCLEKRVKARIVRLRAAIRTFQENQRAGTPFPGQAK